MRSVDCPVGLPHGCCVWSDVAEVMYKECNYCTDATQRGIADNDRDVAIERPLAVEECPTVPRPGDWLRSQTVAAAHRPNIIDQTDRPIRT